MAGVRAGKNSDANSDDWLNARGVRKRIQELQERNAERSELSREEALRWLSDLIRTPIGSVGKDSPLVQAYEEDSEGKVKVRLADKIAGLQTLCRMTGWNEPDQVRLSTTDSLSAYLLGFERSPLVADRCCRLSEPCCPWKTGAMAKGALTIRFRLLNQPQSDYELSLNAYVFSA